MFRRSVTILCFPIIDRHFRCSQTALDSISVDLNCAKSYVELGDIKENRILFNRGNIRIRIAEEQFYRGEMTPGERHLDKDKQ